MNNFNFLLLLARVSIFVLFLAFNSNYCCGQQTVDSTKTVSTPLSKHTLVIDSLKKIVFSLNNNTEKIGIYNELALAYWRVRNSEYGILYTDSAISLAERFKNQKAIAQSVAVKAKLLNFMGEFSKAEVYLNRALKINKQNGDSTECAKNYDELSRSSFNKGNLNECILYCERALKIHLTYGDNRSQSITLSQMGGAYVRKGDYDKALSCYLKCGRMAEDAQNENLASTVYANLGDLYRLRKENDNARRYLLKAIDLSKKINGSSLSGAYTNLGLVYMNEKNYDEALKYFELSKELKILKKEKSGLANVLSNIGVVLTKQDKIAEAEKVLMEAYQIREDLKDNYGKSITTIYLGNAARSGANYKMAEEHYNAAIAISVKHGYKEHLKLAYEGKTLLDSLSGNFLGAFQNSRMSILYKDSILNEQTEKQIAELKVQYETEKNQQQIIQLEGEKKLTATELKLQNVALVKEQLLGAQKTQQLELSVKDNEIKTLAVQQQTLALDNQKKENEKTSQQLVLSKKEAELKDVLLKAETLKRKYITAGIVGLVCVGGYIFYLYQKRKKLSNQLFLSITELKQTQAQLIQLEKEKEAEAIRLRISRDIHDDIGSNLTKIVMLGNLASAQSKNKMPEMTEQLDKISDYARTVNSSMSEIIWAVNPKQDTLENLLAYMRVHTEEFLKNSGINCKINFSEQIPSIQLNPDLKRSLFLVLKESLNNAVKYAEAKNITVTFKTREVSKTSRVSFQMQIADDGKGFNVSEVKNNKGGNGLQNLESRMQQSGCSFNVQSSLGNGCRVDVKGQI